MPISFVLRVLLAMLVLGIADRSNGATDGSPEISVSSDLAAAFLVAYTDYAQATAGDKVPFSIQELPKQFERVSVRKEGTKAVVRFWPPRCEHCTGGGLLYGIDLKTLTVVDRIFGK